MIVFSWFELNEIKKCELIRGYFNLLDWFIGNLNVFFMFFVDCCVFWLSLNWFLLFNFFLV